MAGFFESIMPGVAAAGSLGMGVGMASNLGATGADAQRQMGELAGQLQEDTAFKGYGVTSGLGTSTVGADGSTNLGVGPNTGMQNQGQQAMSGALQGMGQHQQGMLGASNQAMQDSMQDMAGREQDIYNQAMAMQQPGLDQMRANQQAQEFAQGRSGVRGSQFGGTAEDAAMAKAQFGAQNQAAFQAMQQGQQEMMNQGQLAQMYGGMGQGAAGLQGQLGQGMYQNSFMPMDMQMKLMGLGQSNAGMAQSADFTGAGYGAQLGMGGIQADINAQKAATEMYGNMFDSIMDNSGSVGSSLDSIWDKIFK